MVNDKISSCVIGFVRLIQIYRSLNTLYSILNNKNETIKRIPKLTKDQPIG